MPELHGDWKADAGSFILADYFCTRLIGHYGIGNLIAIKLMEIDQKKDGIGNFWCYNIYN